MWHTSQKFILSLCCLTFIVLYQDYAGGFERSNEFSDSHISSKMPETTPRTRVPPKHIPPTPTPPDIVGGNGRVPGPDNYIGPEGPYDGVNTPTGVDYSIVYTSTPRTPGQYIGYDLDQPASDVVAINGGFSETNLEIKHANGQIVEIKNCTDNAVEICAAQEGRVSPDGTRIVYSLGFGTGLQSVGQTEVITGLEAAHLYIYDIAAGTNKKIPNQGATHINRMPDWINNNEIVYSSNAANYYPVKDQFNCHRGTYPDGRRRGGNPAYGCASQSYGYRHHSKSMQIYRMKINGTGQTNLTPHEYMAIRPTVLKHAKNKGRIVFSSWQTAEDKAYYQGAPGPGTTTNLWWLMAIDQNGGDQVSLVGAHHSSYINKNFVNPARRDRPVNQQSYDVDQLMAVRSVGEDNLGRIYFTNYYRGNHFGLGNPYRFSVQEFGVEGCSSMNCYDDVRPQDHSASPGSARYIPEDLFSVAPFGVGSDNTQNFDELGRAMGKLGFMAYLSNGRMLATYGQGYCYTGLKGKSRGWDANKIKSYLGGQPVCDRQIVELLVDRVKDPFDPNQLKIIAGDPNKQEWDAQEIPNKNEYKPVPPQTPPLNKNNGCYLEVVDIRKSELYPLNKEHRGTTFASQVGIQGNAVKARDPGFHPKNVKSLAVYGVALWDETLVNSQPNSNFVKQTNYHGFEDKWLMAETDMEADGSVKMRIPCDVPFQMSGLDSKGTVIAHDTTLHSLRKGETRTCYGCHEGHSVERREAYNESAKSLFDKTLASKKVAPLQNRKVKVSWNEVASIISKRCSSCHSGFQNDDLLWSRVAADNEQLDFPWLSKLEIPGGRHRLARPYFSRILARHPRWSPLYWGCVDERNDGYSNSTYPDDIDFNVVGHNSGATATECKKIADWIQLGAPNY